jgi:hypothetical protein
LRSGSLVNALLTLFDRQVQIGAVQRFGMVNAGEIGAAEAAARAGSSS